jgi:hypothetical protein
MNKNILMISAVIMLLACGGKKAQTDTTDAVDIDSTAILAQEELTFANMAGIYDDEKQESRFCLNEDGTATWCMIGSLNYTEYTYTINGKTICLKPKGVESEDDCYDYDEDTRTLKNEQGAVYYRQVVE